MRSGVYVRKGQLQDGSKLFTLNKQKVMIMRTFEELSHNLRGRDEENLSKYVGESKIFHTIGTCFAVGYTAGWA
jgi:hypothetical protein